MIFETLRRLGQGLYAPRASARWILSGHHPPQTVALLALLSYLLLAILAILVVPGEAQPTGAALFAHVVNAGLHVLSIFFQGLVIAALGRHFGGTGTRNQGFVIAAWHGLVTALLVPVILSVITGAPEAPGLAFLLAALMLYVWTLASFVAELHGFRRVGPVMAVIITMFGVLGMMLVALGTIGH